jgi:hypothetical protein
MTTGGSHLQATQQEILHPILSTWKFILQEYTLHPKSCTQTLTFEPLATSQPLLQPNRPRPTPQYKK